jgi:hypothetical protein
MTLNEITFYNFQIVSRKTGKRFEFSIFGIDRQDAKRRLLNGHLKGQNWNRWELVEVV